MHTGKNDLTKLGLASSWNYSNKTVFSGECGVVNGSFGELYPPHTYSQDKVYLFGFATCRYKQSTKPISSRISLNRNRNMLFFL